jgi:hypothetical protein
MLVSTGFNKVGHKDERMVEVCGNNVKIRGFHKTGDTKGVAAVNCDKGN